jgi:hypothetical protein
MCDSTVRPPPSLSRTTFAIAEDNGMAIYRDNLLTLTEIDVWANMPTRSMTLCRQSYFIQSKQNCPAFFLLPVLALPFMTLTQN